MISAINDQTRVNYAYVVLCLNLPHFPKLKAPSHTLDWLTIPCYGEKSMMAAYFFKVHPIQISISIPLCIPLCIIVSSLPKASDRLLNLEIVKKTKQECTFLSGSSVNSYTENPRKRTFLRMSVVLSLKIIRTLCSQSIKNARYLSLFSIGFCYVNLVCEHSLNNYKNVFSFFLLCRWNPFDHVVRV
jgi:hypothetical protein